MRVLTGECNMSELIYQNGVYDITNNEYHKSHGISRSKLMLFNKSPYHYWYEFLSGEADKKESTPAMNIGSAFHTLLLEPAKFNNEFCVSPKVDRRTKQGKEEFDAFLNESEGKIVLTDEQYTKVSRMVSLVSQDEIVQTLLADSVFEQSIFWTDEETGIQFKTRPDIWSSKMIVDLKTTTDLSTGAFTRSAITYGYYLQAAMAYEAAKAIGRPFEVFTILACEKEAPYFPRVFIMGDTALQKGIDQFNRYKRKLKECMDSNKWPGYPVQELEFPEWGNNVVEEEAA
jgi:exodeoxyribonuclease VIII